MNEPRARFDIFSFLVRVAPIAVGATWELLERLRKHDLLGASLVVAIGYVGWPYLAYLHTRYYNTKFIAPVIEAIRRAVGGRRAG